MHFPDRFVRMILTSVMNSGSENLRLLIHNAQTSIHFIYSEHRNQIMNSGFYTSLSVVIHQMILLASIVIEESVELS